MKTIYLIRNAKKRVIAVGADADIASGLMDALPDAVSWKKYDMYDDEGELPTTASTKKVVYMEIYKPDCFNFKEKLK